MTDLHRRDFLKLAGAGAAALALPPGMVELPVADALAPDSARVGKHALRQLRRDVRGQVLSRGDRGYGKARRVYNEVYSDARPDAVVQVANVRDVKAVVDWANRHDVRVVAKSGGHSYAGYSTTGNGVVVDLRGLRGVGVSRAQGRATVGAGAQLIDVYEKLARKGMTVPAGSCPSVGIAGLTLGGGMGLAGRALGLTCDNLSGVTIVTADGRIRQVDAGSDPDLLWACRGGGGGNFGIVTSLSLDTHRAGRASYFLVSWPWSQAADALDAWQDFAPDAPAALTSILSLSTGSGSPGVSALGQYFGAERRLRRLIRPLTRVGGSRVTVGRSAYFPLMMRWAGCLDESLRACHTRGTSPGGRLPRAEFYAKSDYVDKRLDSRARTEMIKWVERRQRDGNGSGALLLDAYGGAINRVAPGATAFVHRDQRFSIQYLTYFRGTRQRRRSEAWAKGVARALERDVSGQAYQNYIDPNLHGWKQAFYGRNLQRLVDVKTAYDPDWRFRFKQGIPPRG
jgi:FAD/FMN-containing dehydrogenase